MDALDRESTQVRAGPRDATAGTCAKRKLTKLQFSCVLGSNDPYSLAFVAAVSKLAFVAAVSKLVQFSCVLRTCILKVPHTPYTLAFVTAVS